MSNSNQILLKGVRGTLIERGPSYYAYQLYLDGYTYRLAAKLDAFKCWVWVAYQENNEVPESYPVALKEFADELVELLNDNMYWVAQKSTLLDQALKHVPRGRLDDIILKDKEGQ
jgi:hypothetical protein